MMFFDIFKVSFKMSKAFESKRYDHLLQRNFYDTSGT